MGFKKQSSIFLFSLNELSLNIEPSDYGIWEEQEGILHIIGGEFMYCDLLIDAKIIVTEKQMDDILHLQEISIHKIVDGVMWIRSFSDESRRRFNALNHQARFVTTENDDDDEEETEVFRLL